MTSDSDQIKKEALFNEVKGSLFEYLVARRLAGAQELSFLEGLDRNYQNILSQQDRMVRQFYPEMLPFLVEVSALTAEALEQHFQGAPTSVKLRGKFSGLKDEQFEADLVLGFGQNTVPVSLKLNKQGAFVNTKSGGIKSFFQHYFPFIPGTIQSDFNRFVDQEYFQMSHELHLLNDLPFDENFQTWVKAGKSELPGELSPEERQVLKDFYARVAARMHQILSEAYTTNGAEFRSSLAPIMGFGSSEIVQVVCFHEFKREAKPQVFIHSYNELIKNLQTITLRPFGDIASVELNVGEWSLQIRVKPMNKFTTTAIKINCSVKFKRS